MKTLAIIVVCFLIVYSMTLEIAYAQVPSISAISPASGPISTPVTITGTNFSSIPTNNIVYFGAVKALVASASSTALSVSVPTGTTYTPVTVMTGGLSAYSRDPFLVTFVSRHVIDSATFAAKVDYNARDPYNLAIGDIDGDGKSDLIVSNQFDTTISIYRNTSTSGTINSSSFASPVSFRVEVRPVGIAVGDLDGDGALDIAVTGYDASEVSVLRNTSTPGTIAFDAQVEFSTDPGAAPFNVAIEDLNADGKPELIVANDVGGTISVYENQSTPGTITSTSFAPRVNFTTGADPFVAVCDIDNDGKPDLVAANWGSNSVSILRNLNSGGPINSASFASKVDFATGSNPFSVSTGDIDGDGKTDIVTANESGTSISVLRNTSTSGSPSFDPKIDFTTDFSTRFAAITDLDGDGKPDIAACNRLADNVSVLKNQSTAGTISFASKVNVVTGVRPRDIVVGDLDGDTRPDLLVANEGTPLSSNNTISVLRNTLGDGPTITATASSGGTIIPDGAIVVPLGTDTTFAITPSMGHHIDSVVVDGTNQGALTSYTFTNVTANHTISAFFSIN
ncbi:MAG: VCBS repeat-containing protein, partial [Ignavibacteriales bacterium]|nr:VCBS repeat-containing protein [Ignavibacteriales bacterium]